MEPSRYAVLLNLLDILFQKYEYPYYICAKENVINIMNLNNPSVIKRVHLNHSKRVPLMPADALCFSKTLVSNMSISFLEDHDKFCKVASLNFAGDQIEFTVCSRKMFYTDRKSLPLTCAVPQGKIKDFFYPCKVINERTQQDDPGVVF